MQARYTSELQEGAFADSQPGVDGRPRKLSEQAYLAVRGAILEGELRFGDSVTRRGLATQLGMSLPPVSEALQRLELEGLVRSTPRVGTRVCTPGDLDIRGHLVVREALEGEAARLFAEKATPAQRKRLQELASRVDGEFSSPEPDRHRYAELHNQFHAYFVECTGLPVLAEIVHKQLTIWRWLASRLAWEPIVKRLEDEEHPPWDWHESLAEVLRRGDPTVAERRMRHHVRRGMTVIARGLWHLTDSQDTFKA